jgi:hypothetical protein
VTNRLAIIWAKLWLNWIPMAIGFLIFMTMLSLPALVVLGVIKLWRSM